MLSFWLDASLSINKTNMKSQSNVAVVDPSLLSGDYDLQLYTRLIIAVLRDVALVCNQSDTETARDVQEIAKRVRHEGITFLTRTLPSLGKALDKSLASNTVLDVIGFKTEKHSRIPLFMRDIFRQVFSPDGVERSDASPQAVAAIRQVTYLFYKLNLPFTEAQEDEVIDLFRETDRNLPTWEQLTKTYDQRKILQRARALISRVLAPVDPLNVDLLWPKHGPGAVATMERPWEKPVFKVYYQRLAGSFPYDVYFHFNRTHLCDDLRGFLDLREEEAGTARVVLVPKDSRGPRLISCEPPEYQWIQQALMNLMVKTIESHPLTRGRVNFTDQTVNQRMALLGSLTGSLVTLDMKEASDRVSLELVRALFPQTWYDALYACRTTATMLPNGDILPLNKFAPMGSAVCFPVEALIFWALSVASVMHIGEEADSPKRALSRPIYVYGDDIVCDKEDYPIIQRTLPQFGLLFNEDKCCVGDSFRESCGVDAFKGAIVTPLRMKAAYAPSLTGTAYLSWVAFHNAANQRGLFTLCDILAEAIQCVRKTPYTDSEQSECVALCDCRKMAMQENQRLGVKTRMNPRFHCLEAHSWVAHVRTKHADVPGWCEMLRVTSQSPPASKEPLDISSLRRSYLAERALAPYTHTRTLPPINWEKWVPDVCVRAYQYPVPRRVHLKRGWARLG